MIALPDGVADTRGILLHALAAHDESRDRSTQRLPGASELGGCRRRTWFKLVGQEETNVTRRLAAVRGTAFHAQVEQAIEALDPHGERFLTEVTLPGAPGMGPAHIDFVDLERKVMADWKTTTKRNLRFFPKQSQRWQVQVYADRLVAADIEVDTVELVAIPMDGNEDDIRVHSEPRNPELAAEAYAWLEHVYTYKTSGEIPPADMSGVICEQYCPFFGPDTCSGA